MKLTTILEARIPEIGEPIKQFAEKVSSRLNGLVVANEPWDDPREDDISAVFRRIEVNGPEGEDVPDNAESFSDFPPPFGDFQFPSSAAGNLEAVSGHAGFCP